MQFYTNQQCEDWLTGVGRKRPDLNSATTFRVKFPPEPYRIFGMAHTIATSAVAYAYPTLLWITEWGIWPSSENLHLYYRLRESYGDTRLLHDAPGHFFLQHEMEDLATFLQIAMLNGWGGYVLGQSANIDVFFSHDEYVDFLAAKEEYLDSVRKDFSSKQG
jgi:hypothetical protein